MLLQLHWQGLFPDVLEVEFTPGTGNFFIGFLSIDYYVKREFVH